MNEKNIKFSIGYNQDISMLNLLNNYKEHIGYFYFPIPNSFAGSGRIECHKNRYFSDIKKIIERCNKLNIKPLLLLNPTCDGKLIGNTKYMSEIVGYIHKLYNMGLKSVCVTNLLYLHLLKKEMPDLEIHSSVNCYVKNVEHALHLKQLGVDIITIDRDINYDVRKIKKIKKITGLKLTIIVNEGCLRNCPFRQTHFNAQAHSINEKNQNFFAMNSCVKILKKNPHYFFRTQFIRPEDLRCYNGIIDLFKISTRKRTTQQIERMLRAYINREYTGNLLDLIDSDIGKNVKYIDNQKLNKHGFIERMQSCNLPCDSCNFCRDVYKDVTS